MTPRDELLEAEFLRLHDAIQRLYAMTPNDVQREADFLDVRPAILAVIAAHDRLMQLRKLLSEQQERQL